MAAKGPRARARAAVAKQPPAVQDLRWWAKDDPHVAVWDKFKSIGKRSGDMRYRDAYRLNLYGDDQLAIAAQGLGSIGAYTPQTMATNIIRRQVDTFVSKVSKNRPVPMGLTNGGNYSEQRRAKSISKFFEGILDEVGFWPTRTLRLRDSGIVGSGFALNFRVGRDMHHDRLFKREVRVCHHDAERNNPRSLYIARHMDKLIAAERWPAHAEKIFEADADCGDGTWTSTADEDTSHLVLVIEAWHLPSSKGGDDGAHVITTSNATLRNDRYVRDVFPLSKYDYSPPNAHWYGSGIAEQLEGLQYEVNSVGLRLQERNYLMGTYVLCEEGADVEYEAVDNGTLTEVRYTRTPPQFVNPPAAHPDLFNWWRELRTQMPAELTGISGLSSRSEKPAGLDSGKALRTYHDIDTENLTPQGRADEQDVIDTCWQFFDLAEEIYAETKKEPAKGEKKAEPYVVSVETRKHGKTMLEELDYEKVRIDRKNFKLRTFPTNFLRGSPEEQMQSVNEMIEAGFLSQDEALVLLDFPDLQRVLNLRTASRHIIERTLESFIEAEDPTAEGVYQYPEPAMGLELCKALALMTYLDEKLNGAPEGNLKLVMDFYLHADAALKKAEAPAGAPPSDEGAVQDAAAQMVDPALDPMMDPGMAVDPMAGGDAALYAPPEGQLLPEGAVAPEAITALPPV